MTFRTVQTELVGVALSLESSLCTNCGLCCDGSLFADVELGGRRELDALEAIGLDVEDSDDGDRRLLIQPCAGLKNKRCTIYPFRPGCCKTFQCRVLRRLKLGLIPIQEAEAQISEALQQIERINRLLAHFSPPSGEKPLPLKERCQDALAALAETDHSAKGAELERATASLDRLIHQSFL